MRETFVASVSDYLPNAKKQRNSKIPKIPFIYTNSFEFQTTYEFSLFR